MLKHLLFAFALTTPFHTVAAETTTALAQPIYDFRQVGKVGIPAVVSIQVKGKGENSDDEDSTDLFKDDFWQRFFGLPKQNPSDELVSGQASGFLISPDGEILTNSHVVNHMTKITVVLNSGKEYPAKVIGLDTNTDIALIKIDAHDLPYLKLGNSDDLEVGQWVAAIGNPLGLQASLTKGVVSAKGRNNLDLTRIEDYIQTDAPINRGNSGGPLLDMDGRVIGMNTAIVTNMANGGYMGIGFAIPSNLLQAIVSDLKKDGSFRRGYIGVLMQKMDDDLATAFHIDSSNGALVTEVSKDSPALKAGLKQGDIIMKYNGTQVTNIAALRNAISLMKPGTKVELGILRDGKPLQIAVEVDAFPGQDQKESSIKESKLGIELENLTPEAAQKLGYGDAQGVLIAKVAPSSPLAWAGIKKGTLILEVNKQKITSVDEFNQALKLTPEDRPVLMLIKQGSTTRYISIKIG